MTLTNSQYDSIQREYDAAQLRNRRLLEKRRLEVYARCPAYEEAAAEVASLSVRFGKRMLMDGAILADGRIPGNGAGPAAGQAASAQETASVEDYRAALAALSQKKARLLAEAGFPVDYLEPVCDCADCQDTGYVQGRRCHCFEQKIINLLYSQSNLQKLIATENFSSLSYAYYQDEDLENFKKAVETSLAFIRHFSDEPQNLLFFGEVGTGKSFLSGCIAKEILDRGFSVVYFSASALFNLLSKYAFETGSKEMLYKTYEDLYNCDLVIVDDLGAELSNSFTNSQFFTFLNERQLAGKSVIISTNLSLEELKTRYSERIFSRLTGNFTFRKLSGPDIRTCRNI